MANQLYPLAKQAFLDGNLDLNDNNIKVALTRDAYNAAHDFIDDLTLVQSSANLTTKGITNGVFTSDSVTFASVPAGAAINFIVIYEDSGVAATSRLIAHYDTAASGLPVTPDGTNITVNPNASGWFTL